MATQNLFELLGDEEADASAVIERAATVAARVVPKRQQHEQQAAKLLSKPLPSVQGMREASSYEGSGARGRGRDGGGRSNCRGYVDTGKPLDMRPAYGWGYQGDPNNQSQCYNYEADGFRRGRGHRGEYILYEGVGRGAASEGRQFFETGRSDGRGRGRGCSYGQSFEGFQPVYGVPPPGIDQQVFEQPGKELHWGLENEQGSSKQVQEEKNAPDEVNKQTSDEVKTEPGTSDGRKFEEESKEISLNDYYKALDERRKHLPLTRMEERKVVIDKEFETMTLVDRKEGMLAKELEKDKGRRKEYPEREEITKRNVSIQEFLSVEYSDRRGRGRGRGRGHGQGRGSIDGRGDSYDPAQREDLAPCIEDPSEFPTLGAK